jgi:hypothetical protein
VGTQRASPHSSTVMKTKNDTVKPMFQNIGIKNVLFGILLIVWGVDIYFGEPSYFKGIILDRNIGILFGSSGIIWILYELIRKKTQKEK